MKPLVQGLMSIAALSWVAVAVAQPQVLRLDQERDSVSPLGFLPEHNQVAVQKQDPCLPTVKETQAQIAARSAAVSLNMVQNDLKKCQTRFELGMHAAKTAVDKCNYKMQLASRNCEKSGEQPELGESNEPGVDAKAVNAKQEEEEEELHKECSALAKQIKADLEQTLIIRKNLGNETRLDESDCIGLNEKLELSMNHKCCTGKLVSGCPLVGIQGEGAAENLQCKHFTPTGPKSACYYSEVIFDQKTEKYKGNQTVQNQARTNFVQCTTWEYAKNVQVIKRWTHVGFNGNVSGDGAEEWKQWHSDDDFVNIPDPFTEIDAKDQLRKAGTIAKEGQPSLDLGSDNTTPLDDMGTTSVQHETLAKPVGNRDRWTKAEEATTSIVVHALIKNTQQCTMCRKSEVHAKSGALLDLNAPDVRLAPKCNVTKNQRSECMRKKVVQCQKICFMIGEMGIESSGGVVWSQSFREEECPVNQHIATKRLQPNGADNATQVSEHMNEDWELMPNGILTKASAHYGKVTLETIVDVELPKYASVEEKQEYLRDSYESEDVSLKQCCFPGCHIPHATLAGKFYGADNPWYWYNREMTLSQGAGMQFLYQ